MRESQKKEDTGAKNVRKVAGRVGPKVGSLNRRVRSHVFKADMKNCTPLWRQARFQVKFSKHTSFGPLFEVKMHKHTKPLRIPTSKSGRHWLGCGKMARRCGAKHICKSKCAKHTRFGPFLDVQMSNCTPLWHETHFQVKMLKEC